MENINKFIGIPMEAFIEENQRLAYFVAEQFRLRLEYDDAVQLALIGMMKAYRKYDPSEFNSKFSTYAVPMMRGEIMRYLRDHDTQVKYPRIYKDIWSKVRRLGLEEETYESIAEKTGYELRFIEKAMPHYGLHKAVSFEKPIGSDDNGKEVTIGDKIKYEVDFSDINVQEFKRTLTPKKIKVLELRMDKGLTQSEISRIVGVTQVQVSRILKEIGKSFKEFSKIT